jgi:hypothetical protein
VKQKTHNIYNKILKMTNEQLRMQMLSGIITEGQYKAKLQENFFMNLIKKIRNKEEPEEVEVTKQKHEFDDLTDEQALALYNEYGKAAASIDQNDPMIGGYAQAYSNSAQELKKRYPNAIKESLNESMIGGIVGIGAINQIPPRAKADYEMAFEHFLGERYQVKPNRERDDIKDINEAEDGNDWWVKADEELGLDFDGEDLEDLAMNADESWQADFAQQVLDIDASDYEDYKNQVSAIYDETNPF